jgi:ABC-2 type transport system permease protein
MKEWFRNKAAMFWTILFPVLLIIMFGFIFAGEGETTYDLPIQNQDGEFWSTNLTEVLNETGLFEVSMVDPNEDPDEYVKDNDANMILIIPKGYSQQINEIIAQRSMGITTNSTANLTVKYDPGD